MRIGTRRPDDRRRIASTVGVALALCLAGTLGAAPATAATGTVDVRVPVDSPVRRTFDHRWVSIGTTPIAEYPVGAPAVRFVFPPEVTTATDVPVAALEVHVGRGGSTDPCPATARGAARMDGWDLVVDPAALDTCQASDDWYSVSVSGTGRRDTTRLAVELQLVPGTPGSEVVVELPRLTVTQDSDEYLTAPVVAAPGTQLTLHGRDGFFEDTSGAPRLTVLDSCGYALQTPDARPLVTGYGANASTISLRLPDDLPAAAAGLRLSAGMWGGTQHSTDVPFAASAERPGFADTWFGRPFFCDIDWLRTQGISRGSTRPDGSVLFDPRGPVRREAMAAFLYRAAGSPGYTAPAVSPFVDMPTDAAFYREIAWLAERGISTGTDVGDGRREFRPAESVTREAMAAFLHRAEGAPAADVPSPFVDVPADAPFADEIAWLSAAGVSTGTDVGGGRREFRPSEPVTREAMAAFLHRADALG